MESIPKVGGILFLANHPAEIDPLILLRLFWIKFHVHPVAIDYLFNKPVVGYFLRFAGGLAVPNFDYSTNSFKKKQIDRTYAQIFDLLERGENVLVYPAGGLKNGPEEIIGGASGVHTILQNMPNSAKVVLIKTTGLWGSSFSRALSGRTPDLLKAFLHAFKVLLKNGLFFTPRRTITVEISLAPEDFPMRAERLALNRYLEKWYNSPLEPLKLVSYSFWKQELPIPFVRLKEEKPLIDEVPSEIRSKVIEALSSLTKIPAEKISPEHHLSTDMGLDSLDMAQLLVTMKEEFGVSDVQSTDLTTVASLFIYAARIKNREKIEEDEGAENGLWIQQKGRPGVFYPEGETIPEIFFNTCDRMGHYIACVDKITGEIPYKRLKQGVILLAQAIQKLPGERIGIMMPASVAVNGVIIATMLAGKIPVMINWTLGERNIRSILEQSQVEVTLSSWNFIDRLENVDLNGLDNQILLLEEMRKGFSTLQKFTALLRSRKKTAYILRTFGFQHVKGEDPAAILFTSGTESYPKGVPLSHTNIIANLKGAFSFVDVENSDVILGVLPPFHSFGFSVTGLFPLLTGLRVAYFPNPTDGRRMALAIDRWRVSMLCIAPTFLKNILRVASEKQLRSLKLVVTGAEKSPQELFERLKILNPSARLVEGYGITECAPILTLNPPAKPPQGVGLPLPEVELLIVNPETLSPVKQGEEGLILARGPNIFKGYLDPLLPSPFVQVGGKQWYQTGDLGSLSLEGYLTLSGRLKRFIKIGGEMVSLGAVEEILLEAAPQKGWKLDPELPTLAVCPFEEEGKKSEMHLFATFDATLEEVNQVLRASGMSNVIKIRSVSKVPFIPLLATGKTDYRRLAEKLKSINDKKERQNA